MNKFQLFKKELRELLMKNNSWILPTKVVKSKKLYSRKIKHKK